MHSNIAPEYLNDCLSEYLVDNNYNLRNSLQYRVPICSLETFFKSFFSVYYTLWYSLGPNFKFIQTTSKLKQTLKENSSQLNDCYNSIHCNFVFLNN